MRLIKALLFLPVVALLGGCCVYISDISATPLQKKNSGRENFSYSKSAPLQYPSVTPYGKVESEFSSAWNTKPYGTAERVGSPVLKGESVTSCRLAEPARASCAPFRPDYRPTLDTSMGRSCERPSGEVCMSGSAFETPVIVQDWDRWYRSPAVPRSWWYLQKKRGQ